MNAEPYIHFKLIHNLITHHFEIKKTEYFSLLTLISERLQIPGFGVCNGMGSCGTCVIKIKYRGQKSYFSYQACMVACDEMLEGAEVRINVS